MEREARSRLVGARALVADVLRERREAWQDGDTARVAVLDQQRREAFRALRAIEADIGEHFDIDRGQAWQRN
jgi:hypothetical protein